MNAPLPTSVPSSATPIAPPVCRLAFKTPDAIPARSASAESITAVVAAGIVNAIPNPAAHSGATRNAYDVLRPATTRPANPAAAHETAEHRDPRAGAPAEPPRQQRRDCHECPLRQQGQAGAERGEPANVLEIQGECE